jgi:MoxR-like ATPase
VTTAHEADLDVSTEILAKVRAALDSRIVGQPRLKTAMLVALMAEGHLLLESVPGLAKTLASSTLAHVVQAEFSRIQCTPDLLPSDIVGTEVYDPRQHTFETQLGPVFANIVLLDEINRASAKTQSAMLEAMQERQVSIGGHVHPLPRPFMVLATQNPIEQEGTYVLPEAQMDRFLLKEVLDYPSVDEELSVLDLVEDGTLSHDPTTSAPSPVIDTADILRLQQIVGGVYVDAAIKRYIVDLVHATRDPAKLVGGEIAGYIETGASPRASIAFFEVARAVAVNAGRSHVIPEDVREFAHGVLRHRLHLTFDALADRVPPESVIDAIVRAVPTP